MPKELTKESEKEILSWRWAGREDPPPPEDLQMENTEKRRSQAGEGIQISTEMGKSSSSAHASKSLSLAGKEMSRLPSGGCEGSGQNEEGPVGMKLAAL